MRADRRSKKKGSGVESPTIATTRWRRLSFGRWSIYQRFGKLLVRLYEEEEDLSIYFIVDSSSSMTFGDGRKSIKPTPRGRVGVRGPANLDRVTIVGATDQVVSRMPTTRGKGRIFKVFRVLERARTWRHTESGRRHERPSWPSTNRRGLAVLISDLYDPAGFERGINTLRFNKFEPFVLHVVDQKEARPELKGDVRLVRLRNREERESPSRQLARRHGARVRRLPKEHRAVLYVTPSAVLRRRHRHSVR